MIAAHNPGSVVPTRFRWWSAIAGACGKVATVSIPIGLGAYLFAVHWGKADPEYLFTATFSKNPEFLGMNRPGSDGGSGYWISTRVWSVRFVA
jgi:hypothetical protein